MTTLLSTETTRLDGQKKLAKEIGILIEEITTVIEQFGIHLQIQKYEIEERINQLEVVLTTVFEDFEQHFQKEISGCKGKGSLMLLN